MLPGLRFGDYTILAFRQGFDDAIIDLPSKPQRAVPVRIPRPIVAIQVHNAAIAAVVQVAKRPGDVGTTDTHAVKPRRGWLPLLTATPSIHPANTA